MSKLFAIVAEKTEKSDTFSELLDKHKQWHVLQVGARIVRFLHNMTTAQKQRAVAPLTTEEIDYILDQVSPKSSHNTLLLKISATLVSLTVHKQCI